MTVDEVLDELCAVCQLSKRVRVMLEALLLTESERAAALAEGYVTNECEVLADIILRTSPGRADGVTSTPMLTKNLDDVRGKLLHFKSEAYAEFNQKECNPLAEAIRVCYVAHVQLLLDVVDAGNRGS